MSLYLDASVLLPTLVQEPASETVDLFVAGATEALLVSEFAIAEVASALSRLVRTHVLDSADALARLADFDAWRAAETTLVDVESADIRSAAVIVRQFDLMLRAPDAVHLAVCRRSGATLVTLDNRLALAANAMGVKIVMP